MLRPPSNSPDREPARRLRKQVFTSTLVSVFTIIVLLAATEVVSRKVFATTRTSSEDCLILNDPTGGVRAQPNCSSVQKIPESGYVQYSFDNCGYRSGMTCGTKAAGVYRIVLIGSSVAEGLRVAQQETFAARLGPALTRLTGRQVEVYNEGLEMRMPRDVAANFGEVLRAKPDLILWTLTPLDIEHSAVLNVPWLAKRDSFNGKVDRAAAEPDRSTALYARICGRMRAGLATTFLLEHLLYESQSEYVDHFLMQGDGAAFLRSGEEREWDFHVRRFSKYAEGLAQQARAAGIPMVVTAVPQRAQAAMISMGHWPDGYDPYRFGRRLQSIAWSNGLRYANLLHAFQAVTDAERDYFPVDGHPNSKGHELLARLLAHELRPEIARR